VSRYAVGVTSEPVRLPGDHEQRLGRPRRRATEDEARAMASAIRLRILRLCLDESLTNKQLAERLGKDPASVLYHVRRLVRTGFLVPEPERRGTRGAREVPYRATGKSWILDVVDPELHRAGSVAMFEAFLDDVRDAGVESVSMSRLGLRLSDAENAEFRTRMHELLDEFARRDSEGEPWSVFLAIHPDSRPVRKSHAEYGGQMTPSEDDDRPIDRPNGARRRRGRTGSAARARRG
jgi:DNA-binding transcriptional ArsR family regulator